MMGQNSVLLILNDHLNEIARDPEFGKKVADAILRFSRLHPERIPYVTGQTQVINAAHADIAQVIRVGANCGRVIGNGHWQQTDDDLIAFLHSEVKKARKAKATGAAP